MTNTILSLIHFVTYAFGLMCLLRFLVQVMYVEPTNAIVKILVKITDPLLNPLRAVIPRSTRLDVTSGLIAWISSGVSVAIQQMLTESSLGVVKIIIVSFSQMLTSVIWTFLAAIIATAVLSWFTTNSQHPALRLAQQISARLTNPVRRFLPALGPMDFSPAVVLIILFFLNNSVVGPLRLFGLSLG